MERIYELGPVCWRWAWALCGPLLCNIHHSSGSQVSACGRSVHSLARTHTHARIADGSRRIQSVCNYPSAVIGQLTSACSFVSSHPALFFFFLFAFSFISPFRPSPPSNAPPDLVPRRSHENRRSACSTAQEFHLNVTDGQLVSRAPSEWRLDCKIFHVSKS